MPALSEDELTRFRGLIYEWAGITLTPGKRHLIINRLSRELEHTGCRSFRDYTEQLLADPTGELRQRFINALTTNKTAFFREPDHFQILAEQLRRPSRELASALARGLRIWCAASSTGEEPYTLASVLSETLSRPQFLTARIVASDIDTRVLETARRGIYGEAAVSELPHAVTERMFAPGRGRFAGSYRIRRELRERVSFFRHNLLGDSRVELAPFDVVFLRNVLIYFDAPNQRRVIEHVARHLAPQGLLFLGHSESLLAQDSEFSFVAHTVYRFAPRRGPSRRVSAAPRPRTSLCPNPLARSSFRSEPRLPAAVRSLAAGDSLDGNHGWVSLRLQSSALFVMHGSDQAHTAMLHLSTAHKTKSAEALRSSLRRLFSGSLLDTGRASAAVTVRVFVGCQPPCSDSTVAEAVLSEPTRSLFEEFGLGLPRPKVLTDGTELRVHLATGRVMARLLTKGSLDR